MASVIRVLVEHRVGGDAVSCHSTWRPESRLASARLSVAAALTLLRLPRRGVVVHVHLSERGSFVREGLLVALARRRGLMVAVTIHGASFTPFAHSHPRLVAAVLRRARLVTCLDRDVLDVVRRLAPRVRSEMVPNPVFVDSDSSGADETDELVVFAGEIGLRKGADVLHRAWKLVADSRPAARCLLIGPVADFVPPPTERLEVREPVDSTQIRVILRSARVVVLPSRAEGMPMILTEAMSVGRPFVSTPVGGIPELAGEGGMLVPVDDEIGLAQRLTDLLASPERARDIGDRGRQLCLKTRSVEVIDARLRELYGAAALTESLGRPT
jgi:glycosyltransferase involved in cell wall biosynthesis